MTHLQEIIFIAAEVCDLDVSEVVGPVRSRPVLQARAIVVRLARVHTRSSFPEIADALNRRSHTTAIGSLKTADRLSSEDPDFRRRYQAAEERVLREVVA